VLLLGIWLIATGLTAFVHISFVNIGLALSLLGVVAGVLILLGR